MSAENLKNNMPWLTQIKNIELPAGTYKINGQDITVSHAFKLDISAPDKWHDIETAPKDGTGVMLFAKAHNDLAMWVVGYYKNDRWLWGRNYKLTLKPTHWQPLADAPKT